MYTMDYFVDLYLDAFPNEKNKINQHIELNGMFLGHIFFDEEICGPLCHMLNTNCPDIEVKKFVYIIERMLFEGDDYVKSVVILNILKKIKAEKDIINKAQIYFNDKTIEIIRSEWGVI